MLLIVYSYSISDLLDSAQLQSMYKANTILDSSETAADDTVISDEDHGMCGSFLKAGAIKIQRILSGYSQGIVDANGTALKSFEWDTEDEHKIIFRTAMPDTFNQEATYMIDEAILSGLENFMLMKVAKLRGIDFASYEENWDEATKQISVGLCKRIKPIERKHNFY